MRSKYPSEPTLGFQNTGVIPRCRCELFGRDPGLGSSPFRLQHVNVEAARGDLFHRYREHGELDSETPREMVA